MEHYSTHDDIERVLYTSEQIAERVNELGAQITADYRDRVLAGEELVLVTLLRGAAFFSSDLSRAIKLPVILDYMKVSSYGNAAKSSGIVTIESDITVDVKDKHVLLVEDVIDSGVTLKFMRKNMLARGPLSVEIAAFLQKDSLGQANVPCKYVGLGSPDEFLVGYGLDYAGRYRNFPGVCVLKPEIYS